MFYVFRTRYRIVVDHYAGYEAQFRYWWMPYYMMVGGLNTCSTIRTAEDLIDAKRRYGSCKVVKQIV